MARAVEGQLAEIANRPNHLPNLAARGGRGTGEIRPVIEMAAPKRLAFLTRHRPRLSQGTSFNLGSFGLNAGSCSYRFCACERRLSRSFRQAAASDSPSSVRSPRYAVVSKWRR